MKKISLVILVLISNLSLAFPSGSHPNIFYPPLIEKCSSTHFCRCGDETWPENVLVRSDVLYDKVVNSRLGIYADLDECMSMMNELGACK